MSAKELLLRPVDASIANAFMTRVHYSASFVRNSQVHFGVYWHGTLEGVMQFGPSMVKRGVLTLVDGTGWNQVIELNRLAFTHALPRNSESRALSIALRLLRRHAPHVKWVITFADGTQCGDGTIYRASGFLLTDIRKNLEVWGGNGATPRAAGMTLCKGKWILQNGRASTKQLPEAGFHRLDGFMFRYVKFLDPSWRDRLTVPVLPYTAIAEAGASMYRGVRAGEAAGAAPGSSHPAGIGRFESDPPAPPPAEGNPDART